MSIQQKPNNEDVQLSKLLSFTLRHGASKLGLKIDQKDIKRVVETNDKKRFVLVEDQQVLKIKACQGHSIKNLELELQEIKQGEIQHAVHGTYYKNWENIKKTGLKSLNRKHIHFSSSDNLDLVTSGFRSSAQILVYLDLDKCFADNIKIFKSENNVILSEGVEGTIEPKYFLKVVDRKTGKLLN